MTNASSEKTKHVIQLDQRESAESGKLRSHLLPVLLRVLLPVAALVSGWVGYSILSVEPEDVERPEAEERMIKTRANQARLNWEDLGYDEEPSDLVLRGPQLREAEANMKSAKAQLDQANRNLERTKVRAPFDGRVRRRTVGLGQSVGPGTPLGSVFAIEFAEVRLPITARDMAFLTLPEGPDDPPVEVQLRDALAQDETVWAAQIIRTEGTLDENSLELFAIARVSDPFGRRSPHPPLRIGQPVVATMPGSVLKDVLVVPRVAVRQLDHIILLDPNELTIESRRIETIWSDEECVIVRDPTIADGSLLATTHLIYAPDGSKVEILPDPNLPTQDMAGFESRDKAAGKEQL
jgi:multidrug efflux pump subunit AcrA (membrane-fusion protein)